MEKLTLLILLVELLLKLLDKLLVLVELLLLLTHLLSQCLQLDVDVNMRETLAGVFGFEEAEKSVVYHLPFEFTLQHLNLGALRFADEHLLSE